MRRGTVPTAVRALADDLGDVDLLEDVRTVAAAWLALGVDRRDHVAVWAPESRAALRARLAAPYIGAVTLRLAEECSAHVAVEATRHVRARILVLADGAERARFDELVEAAAAVAGFGGAGAPVPGLPDTTDVVRIRCTGSGPVYVGGVFDFDSLSDLAAAVPDRLLDDRADAVGPDDLAEEVLAADGSAIARLTQQERAQAL